MTVARIVIFTSIIVSVCSEVLDENLSSPEIRCYVDVSDLWTFKPGGVAGGISSER